MSCLGANGNGGMWGMGPFRHRRRKAKDSGFGREARSSSSGEVASFSYRFPLKQAATAASLAFTGDTIAQLHQRWSKDNSTHSQDFKDAVNKLLSEHDWVRALRMTSYGFLLYGPGSYAWYQYLDRCMPELNIPNMMTKVLLNQIVLGPTVIGVVFAWNSLWQGKLAELPNKYKKDALPTLFTGFKFWVPVSILNFWMVPLQARVAFMATGSIFWNFILSSTIMK